MLEFIAFDVRNEDWSEIFGTIAGSSTRNWPPVSRDENKWYHRQARACKKICACLYYTGYATFSCGISHLSPYFLGIHTRLTTYCVPQGKFSQKPYNKSFIDQACSVKMAGYCPRSFSATLQTHAKKRDHVWSINPFVIYLDSHLTKLALWLVDWWLVQMYPDWDWDTQLLPARRLCFCYMIV